MGDPPIRLSLLVAGPEGAFSLPLPDGVGLILGRGAAADVGWEDPKVAARHLRVRARGELVEVENLAPTGSARLNDVQLSRVSAARAGDQIEIGATVIIVQASKARPAPERPLPHEAFQARLNDEVRRALRSQSSFGLAVLRLPRARPSDRIAVIDRLALELRGAEAAVTWGELGSQTLALLLDEALPAQLEALKDRITAGLGEVGQRFQLGFAVFPLDGVGADRLLEAGLSRMNGHLPSSEEPHFVDPVMGRLLGLIDSLAKTGEAVLLEGPPGSGKETLARLLHQRSARAEGPFVVLHCPGSSAAALEGELFGYQRQEGKLEAASSGTLYLAGAEALTAPLQGRLLRAFADGVLGRTGSSKARPIDVRLLAGSSSAGEVKGLARFTLTIPGLADRPAEIQPLADQFLARCRRQYGRPKLTLSGETRALLDADRWPGNVRELKNVIERAALATDLDEIHPSSLPSWLGREVGDLAGRADLRSTLRATEREALLGALAGSRWNVTEAARRLGLPRRTVVYRMGRLGLRRPSR